MKEKIIISLFLLTVFCGTPVFAQEKQEDKEKLSSELEEIKTESFPVIENQCKLFGKSDFAGTEISFEVVNADIREILTLANPFGCNFTVDEKVGQIPITVKVNNVPWNLALRSILESQDLAIQIEDSNFRIIEAPYSCNPSFFLVKKEEDKLSEESLYTEFIQLKNLNLESRGTPPYAGTESPLDSDESKDSAKFFNLLRKKLSRRGAIEFDNRSQTLIVTDEKSRIKIISDFVKLLDESGFTLEEIVNEPNLQIN
jgi:type II secretory pathway component HofQ